MNTFIPELTLKMFLCMAASPWKNFMLTYDRVERGVNPQGSWLVVQPIKNLARLNF